MQQGWGHWVLGCVQVKQPGAGGTLAAAAHPRMGPCSRNYLAADLHRHKKGMLSQQGRFARTGQSIQLGNGRGLSFQPHSCWCSLLERAPGAAHKQDYCTVPFLCTAQLFEQPEMGSLIRWTHGIHPKWKCFHPPAPMVSVLSNSNLPNAQVMNEQMPRLRTSPDLCLPRTASLLPSPS